MQEKAQKKQQMMRHKKGMSTHTHTKLADAKPADQKKWNIFLLKTEKKLKKIQKKIYSYVKGHISILCYELC